MVRRSMRGHARAWQFGGAVTVMALLSALPVAPARAGSPGATVRVSVSSTGAQGTGGTLPAPALSDDGRYVTFHTRAAGLVGNDTNGDDDIFVHDRQTGTTTRVSVAPGGVQANGPSFFPDISGDGRFVAFGSGASNLVPGDTNHNPPSPTAAAEFVGRDVFVYDRTTGAVTRESVSSEEAQAQCFAAGGALTTCGSGGAALSDPDLSFDGRYVAFGAAAGNLVAGDDNRQTDVFVRDRQAGTTTRVSVTVTNTQSTGGASLDPSISADGRYVAFRSNAINLLGGGVDTNDQPDIFVRDTVANTTVRASVADDESQATGGGSLLPSLSADGRYVAFSSAATNLVPGDTNGVPDIFVRDLVAGTTTRVSVATGGGQANGGSFVPGISGNGRFVAFDSPSTNLVAGDTNGVSDIFVHDRETGTTTRVSVSRFLTQADKGSFFPALNFDGRFATFGSDATNLVPGDTNEGPDAFVHDRTQLTPSSTGYRLVASDGGIFAFGDAGFFGSTGALRLNRPIEGMASTPRNLGYWLVAEDGGIFAFGDAQFFGSTGGMTLNQPIVGMASTPLGQGYLLVASDGGIFAFGDAKFHGSTGALRLNQPIRGMATTPSGLGYWLVAADGGIFAFGDARFLGSTGGTKLNKPIVGMAATPTGRGYWLVAEDGGIFAFGDAQFFGSTGALTLNQPIRGMAANASGKGYWLVAADGGIFAFGDAAFLGSTGALRLNRPVEGMAAG
jgi:Tol biopolymer transport system component